MRNFLAGRNWQVIGVAGAAIVVWLLLIVWLALILPSDWQPLLVLGLGTGILAVAAAAYYTSQSISYIGALIAMAPEALLVAALCTIFSYIGHLNPAPELFSGPHTFAVAIGIVAGLVSWLLFAVLY